MSWNGSCDAVAQPYSSIAKEERSSCGVPSPGHITATMLITKSLTKMRITQKKLVIRK